MRGSSRLLNRLRQEPRVRFAPSPTGFLHLGGLRSALYNFLFAKKVGGVFILRIEDTDRTRIVPGAVEALVRDLRWSGLPPDEGPGDVGGDLGPYLQSERLPSYSAAAAELIERGAAYRCFCSQHRIDLLRKDAARCGEMQKGYDNRCRHLSAADISAHLRHDESHTIRLRLDDVDDSFNDFIFGVARTENLADREGDPVILKSDGFPTYHLANVVDDHEMQISHVFRGAEWLTSTPKHLRIYKAFGWEPPSFGHIPLIMTCDGRKLSKRDSSLGVGSLRDAGFAPPALLSYICDVGGGILPRITDEDDVRVYDLPELVSMFDVCRLPSTAPGRFDDSRLKRFARAHFRRELIRPSGRRRLLHELRRRAKEKFGADVVANDDETLLRILEWSSDRASLVKDLVDDEDLRFLWTRPRWDVVGGVADSIARSFDAIVVVEDVALIVAEMDSANVHRFVDDLRSLVSDHPGLVFRDLMMLTRWSLAGAAHGPPVTEIVEMIGRDEAVERIRESADFLRRRKDLS